jgi:hypothetical protein
MLVGNDACDSNLYSHYEWLCLDGPYELMVLYIHGVINEAPVVIRRVEIVLSVANFRRIR